MKIRILSIGSIYEFTSEQLVIQKKEDYLAKKKDPDTEIIRRMVKGGTTIIESRLDRIIAGYHVVKEALKAKEELDFDAIFVRCFADPAIDELRELFDVPVLGSFQACAYIASLLGHKFSVVTVGLYAEQTMKDLAAHYGLSHKLASVRYLKISPLELGVLIKKDRANVCKQFIEIANKCIKEDDADVILPGCGYFTQIIDEIRESVEGIVLDPTITPLRMLETLVKMNLSHNKKIYPSPTKKHLQQYKL